jgi:hypothetical protein
MLKENAGEGGSDGAKAGILRFSIIRVLLWSEKPGIKHLARGCIKSKIIVNRTKLNFEQ